MLLLPMLPVAALSLALAADGPGLTEAPSDPVGIVGGTMAETCQFPAVVSILEDDATPVMCSGSLIHPQVVMTGLFISTPAASNASTMRAGFRNTSPGRLRPP